MAQNNDLVEYAIICVKLHFTLGGQSYESIMNHPMTATMLTQYNVEKWIKIFGKEGEKTVEVELKQLNDRSVMEPIYANKISREENRASFKYLMFLKQKTSGKIIGRGCSGGRKQRAYVTKEEAVYPTAATEALMLI